MDGSHFRTHLLLDMDRGSDHGNWLTVPEPRRSRSRRPSGSMPRRTPSRGRSPDPSSDRAYTHDPTELQPLLQHHNNNANDPERRFPVDTTDAEGDVDMVDQDCFMIPAHRMVRFLPAVCAAGPVCRVPRCPPRMANRPFNMMQIDDPQVCIVLDFLENLRPLSPAIPTLMSAPHPLTVQLAALRATVLKVKEGGTALEGMALMNMERNSVYPFISYMILNTSQTDPIKFQTNYHSIICEQFAPDKIQHIGEHHIACYEEVATIARPPIDVQPRKPPTTKTGFIITVFKTFPGDDREKLERSWLMWTGARMTYKSLPKCVGLRRITFHKKMFPDGGITYVLLCECSNLLDALMDGCGFIENLRARCCGYTGLYKIMEIF